MDKNEGFENEDYDYEVMDDEADVALHALGGDELEDAVIQDFSDSVTGASPVNGESYDVAMEEDGDSDDARKGSSINKSKQVSQECNFFNNTSIVKFYSTLIKSPIYKLMKIL